jgi:hypothetical protein
MKNNMIVKLGGDKKMKRNLSIAIAVTVLMVAATVAQAADVTFSGQVRPRFNIDTDSSDITSPAEFFDTRVRLNAKANVNANTEVFLQLQSVGVWGGGAANSGTREATGGGTGAGDAAEASDLLNDVGFHQAYLTLKNLANTGLDAKIGRQEIVIDGHRLFGHTGWTQGAQTNDAIRLTHAAGNHSLSYTFLQGDEADSVANSNAGDETVQILYASTQGILGGSLSGIFTITNDDNAETNRQDATQWFTVGARQKGKIAGLDYRVEFYHQFGDAAAPTDMAFVTNLAGTGNIVDRDAQMVGVRVGKTFANKLGVTFWYDMLTGIDDDGAAADEMTQFDTMYDTGHKFYGFMDLYLHRGGAGTGFYGMQDFAIKAKMPIRAGWTAKADMHWFRTHTDLTGGDSDTVRAADASIPNDNALGNDLGSELDLTLVHKYDSNTTIAAGYSHYWSTVTFAHLNAAGGATSATGDSNDDADWMYVQIDTKF